MPTSLFFRRVNAHRLIDRSCESLIGICRGLLADEVLNEQELRFLDVWLADAKELSTCWPGSVIHERVAAILHDGRVTKDELAHLQEVLEKLVGGTLEKAGGAASGLSSQLATDDGIVVSIDGREFCLTGTFLFGPRSRCSAAITELGGHVRDGVCGSLNYLVIGGVATETWANSSFGRKIERAMELKARGADIWVISEEQWVAAIDRCRNA